MGNLSEIIHAKRERAIVELVKGKEVATQLQTLLQKPVEDHGPINVEDLALQICRSFTETLSVLSSSAASSSGSSSAQISAVDGGKKAGGKDRRGCYKRRRTSDSWMTISPLVEDCYAWRKYGQKDILNAEYPRCYFRCTHKHQGCKATKQVQKIKDDPILYQTTYFNHHTCIDTPRAPPLIVDLDPVEPNLLSFQTDIQSKQDHHDSAKPVVIKKEESKDQDTQSEEDVSDEKSNVDPWEGIIGAESIGYKPMWAPMVGSYHEDGASGFHSCGSTSLHGLDVEVNQLGDIDNFHFDEIY